MKGKIIIALAFLCLVTMPAQAVIVKEECFNSTHQIDTYNYTEVLNNTATSYDYIQIHKCLNGCSTTLGKCRVNDYKQALFAITTIAGMLIFCAIMMWISEQTDTATYVATHILASVITIFIAITDWFSVIYRTIFLAVAFIPLTFIVFVYLRTEREKKKVG